MLDDPGRARTQVECRDGARLVGEQAHACRVRRDPRDRPDEPVGGHDRRVDGDAVVGAGGDDDRLVERARGLRDHLGGDAVVVLWERGRVLVVQQALEPDVLLQRRLVLDHLLLELLVLGAQLLVLGARVEEILRPAVGIAERPRDPLGRDLERLQRVGDCALSVVQRPVGRSRNEAVIRASESRTRVPSTTRRRTALRLREGNGRGAGRRTPRPSTADLAVRLRGTSALSLAYDAEQAFLAKAA